jgi:phosphatidylglycerol:prolipoprotein diacylglycerol transferase
LAGVALACWLFTRNKPVDFLALTDVLVFPVAIFLALGRSANFVNGELYGIITDLPWGVKFAGVDGFRHPTQLYEALKNLYIFAVLYYVRAANPHPAPFPSFF